jgi:predicted DNA-binding WGR domain protein
MVFTMALHSFRLYCQRIDATKNMARYYALSLQPTLFGEMAVVRCWGRIGSRGGEKCEVFATDREAARHFLELARIKRIKGYRPVGNCGNPGNSTQHAAAPQ